LAFLLAFILAWLASIFTSRRSIICCISIFVERRCNYVVHS
jgi:hypothetical protein